MNNRIDIGIDVGWSEFTRSCGVAVRGINPGWEGRHVVAYGNGIAIKLFRLKDLLEWLPTFITMIGDGIHRTTVVVDGPIGLTGRPQINRHVDSACRRNGFYGRVFPNDVTGENGQRYVDTTYQIIDRFLTAGKTRPWLGQSEPKGLIIAETHPTVGLATLLPKLDPSTLPSRRRPFTLVDLGGRLVTAKSDWYWMRGAGRIVAGILDEPSIAADTHHERRAAHFCLANAVSLSQNNAFAIGRSSVDVDADRSGVYVLPQAIHADWAADVDGVGITYGAPQAVRHVDLIDIPFSRREHEDGVGQVNIPPHGDCPDDDGELPYGQQLLCLRDNGGIWSKHNPWLEDCDNIVEVKALDGPGEQIHLRLAGGNGQWTLVNDALTIRGLAQARGFTERHLSLKNGIDIPIEVTKNRGAAMNDYFYGTFPSQLHGLAFRRPNDVVREHIMQDPSVIFFGGPDWKNVAADIGTVPAQDRCRFILSLFMVVLTDQALYTYFPDTYDAWRARTNFPKFGWSGFGPHNENPFKILRAPERDCVIDADELLAMVPEFVGFFVDETTNYFQQHLPGIDVHDYFAAIRDDQGYLFNDGAVVPRVKAELERLMNP